MYGTFTAEVPVSFTSTSKTDSCTAVMETKNNSPAPYESELNIAKDSEEEFKIDISEPGTYRYTVYQKPGNNTNITYDDTVYTVTVFVTVNKNNTLKYAIVAATNKSMEKPDKIEFKNRAKGENQGGGENGGGGGGNSDKTDEKDKTDSSADVSRRGGKSSSLNSGKPSSNDSSTEKTSESDTEKTSENEIKDPDNNTENNEPDTEENREGEVSADDGFSGSGVIGGKDGDNNNDDNNSPEKDIEITAQTAVNTGDSNKQGLWIALMCASLAVIVMSAVAEKAAQRKTA
ncbi:MAG: hypothetical protein IJL89_08695 [Firmicutes bacterium]|nr:hypothetical protein [Bacillota bacterium]